ncbi:CBS domain-containing protein [Methanotorris formicicus]|uniref:Putative signal transduction protein with CBS domains n=1 Tax=Methanotorris formicicus Mc-S-70 TaxID=647171 RepID=H1KZF3_9EURY|nr:CBS domain-containing protein [Methanotorris formicicus]EHP86073.1 putative signal transduction protein with CBS domains [Methanotorris formicicus Mc-S-70]
MKVKEIMNPDIYKVDENENLYGTFKVMHDKGIRRVFVEKDGKIVGVVSYRDLVNVFVSKGLFELIETKIGDIATKNILKIREDDDIKDAAKIMVHADVSALLVVDNQENPVGVVSQTDILRVFIKE